MEGDQNVPKEKSSLSLMLPEKDEDETQNPKS